MLSSNTARIVCRPSFTLARRSIFYQVFQRDLLAPHPSAAVNDIQSHLESIEAHIQTLKHSLDTPEVAMGSSAIQVRRLLHLLDSSANEIRQLTHHAEEPQH
jgi:hypothetical protein